MTPTEPWADSRTPALALLARGDQVEVRSTAEYAVRSQSQPDRLYTVTIRRNRWGCTCQFHTETGMACLHVLAVKFRAGFQGRAAPPEVGPTCERCHSTDVIQTGRRMNKSGPVRRFRCKTCGAYFSGREGFHKRRADPEMIAKALDLYFRSNSLRQVADHFRQAYGLKVSHVTIYRWVVHYSRLAAEWMDAQGAKVGTTWHVDERVVNVNGEHRYLWNVMDSETRFLLATAVSEARSFSETRLPLERAKLATASRPTELRTDGMRAYPWAVKAEFGPGVHRRVPSIRAAESNNLVERLHGSEKDRTKTMRAFDNDRGCAALSEGWRVHYDMVRDHLSLGTTPGIAAGLPDLGQFRWRTLIELATSRNVTAAPGVAQPDD